MIVDLALVQRMETGLESALHELDNVDSEALGRILALLGQFLRGLNTGDGTSTSEWAAVMGDILISWYPFIHVGKENKDAHSSDPDKKLEQHRAGMQDTLHSKFSSKEGQQILITRDINRSPHPASILGVDPAVTEYEMSYEAPWKHRKDNASVSIIRS
jgi:hypothetical protein